MDTVVPFRGYSVAVSGDEKQVQRLVRENTDRYARLVARFAAGPVDRRRFVGRLDTDRAEPREWDYRARFAMPDGSSQIYLHLRARTPEAIGEKVLADFILSPAVKSVLAEAGPEYFERDRDKAFESCFFDRNWHELSLGLARDARFALANTTWLRELMRGADAERAWKARALLCAVGEKDLGEKLWEPIAAIPDGEAWLRRHALLLRIATDDEWPEARDRVARAYRARGEWDEYVTQWWEPLLAVDA